MKYETEEILMLRNLVQIVRVKVGSKAIVVGVAAASLVALAGGWAFAGHGPAHVTGPSGSLASAAFHAAGSSGSAGTDVSQNGSHAPAPQAGTPLTTQPQSFGPLPKMPAGLLQGLAQLSVQGHGTPVVQSATGGGSTVQFHFGFTAQPHRNGNVAGTVTGNAEINFLAPNGGPLHIDVNCLEVIGNDAYMSGTLTYTAFGLTKGTEMLFGVQDDDSAAKADLISNIYYSPAPPFTCHTFHAKPQIAVQGNIEIH
jgi:hypothetical protein